MVRRQENCCYKPTNNKTRIRQQYNKPIAEITHTHTRARAHIPQIKHQLHQSRLNTMSDAMKREAAERKEDREREVFIESGTDLKYLTEV